VRASALDQIARRQARAPAELIASLALDPDPRVRAAALRALAAVDATGSAPRFVEALGAAEPEVRTAGRSAFLRLPLSVAVEAVRTGSGPEVSGPVLDALAAPRIPARRAELESVAARLVALGLTSETPSARQAFQILGAVAVHLGSALGAALRAEERRRPDPELLRRWRVFRKAYWAVLQPSLLEQVRQAGVDAESASWAATTILETTAGDALALAPIFPASPAAERIVVEVIEAHEEAAVAKGMGFTLDGPVTAAAWPLALPAEPRAPVGQSARRPIDELLAARDAGTGGAAVQALLHAIVRHRVLRRAWVPAALLRKPLPRVSADPPGLAAAIRRVGLKPAQVKGAWKAGDQHLVVWAARHDEQLQVVGVRLAAGALQPLVLATLPPGAEVRGVEASWITPEAELVEVAVHWSRGLPTETVSGHQHAWISLRPGQERLRCAFPGAQRSEPRQAGAAARRREVQVTGYLASAVPRIVLAGSRTRVARCSPGRQEPESAELTVLELPPAGTCTDAGARLKVGLGRARLETVMLVATGLVAKVRLPDGADALVHEPLGGRAGQPVRLRPARRGVERRLQALSPASDVVASWEDHETLGPGRGESRSRTTVRLYRARAGRLTEICQIDGGESWNPGMRVSDSGHEQCTTLFLRSGPTRQVLLAAHFENRTTIRGPSGPRFLRQDVYRLDGEHCRAANAPGDADPRVVGFRARFRFTGSARPPESLSRQIRTQVAALRACRSLPGTGSAGSGLRVEIVAVVESDGRVRVTSLQGSAPAQQLSCYRGRTSSWRFPAPGRPVVVAITVDP
jgi:hypothetical protein